VAVASAGPKAMAKYSYTTTLLTTPLDQPQDERLVSNTVCSSDPNAFPLMFHELESIWVTGILDFLFVV